MEVKLTAKGTMCDFTQYTAYYSTTLEGMHFSLQILNICITYILPTVFYDVILANIANFGWNFPKGCMQICRELYTLALQMIETSRLCKGLEALRSQKDL